MLPGVFAVPHELAGRQVARDRLTPGSIPCHTAAYSGGGATGGDCAKSVGHLFFFRFERHSGVPFTKNNTQNITTGENPNPPRPRARIPIPNINPPPPVAPLVQ